MALSAFDTASTAVSELVRFLRTECPDFGPALAELGDHPSAVDLCSLGFTLQDNTLGQFRGPAHRPWCVYLSGGTSGAPKMLPYTQEDWQQSISVTAQALRLAGVTSDDTCFNFHPFGAWAIGQVHHEAIQELSATAIAIGIHLPTQYVGGLASAYKPTVLIGSVHYLLALAEAPDLDWLRSSRSVRLLVTAGELLTPGLRKLLSNSWGAPARSIYGSAETDTLAAECSEESGHHLFTANFVTELMGLGLIENVPVGTEGEILVTALYRRARPLLRYQLRDRIRVVGDNCACGVEGPLIQPLGRSDGGITLGEGTTLTPNQIGSALEALGPPFIDCQLVVSGRIPEVIDVRLLATRRPRVGERAAAERFVDLLGADLSDAISSGIVISATTIVSAKEFARSVRGKVGRIVDARPH